MADPIIAVTPPALPKGGGAIKGIGETFQPYEFTGTAALSIPIPTPAARGFEPHLSVDYSSGAGNGVFGLGWALSVTNITRKTSKGTPRYDGSDSFILSNAEELVPVAGSLRHVTVDNVTYDVTNYRPRSEGLFAKIEHWVAQGSGQSYWRVISKENVTSIYGASPEARIAHPRHPTRVFQWLLQERFDANGNVSVYEYEADSHARGLSNGEGRDRVPGNNRYLARIKYGNDPALTPEERRRREELLFGTLPALSASRQEMSVAEKLTKFGWHFEVVFDYGRHTVAPDAQSSDKKYEPPGEKSVPDLRKDPFSTYHAGFEIRTRRLCRNILIFHRFKELGPGPILTHATRFHYRESHRLSLLEEVESVGYRLAYGRYQTSKLPPLTFGYTHFDPSGGAFTPFLDAEQHALPGVESPRYQLIDLYGEGLPGVLYGDGRTVLYWDPVGVDAADDGTDGQVVSYDLAGEPERFPLHRDFGGTGKRLMDLTGDGALDLVVASNGGAGYYQVRPDRDWETLRPLPATPTDFSDPDGQFLDFTGDGLADLVRIEHEQVKVYPGRGREGFDIAQSNKRPSALPWPARTRRDEAVLFADIFGTGGSHLVKITRGRVECWPHLGYGEFADPVVFDNPPQLPADFDAARLFLVDLDGSGTADIVYGHEDRIEIWFNESGNAFKKQSKTVPLPAPNTATGQLSFADVQGTGTTAVVFSDNSARPRHWYLDLSGGYKAHLLNKIDNNLGAVSTITYASSTKFYLADKQAGRPWLTRLPFPVQVVEKIVTEEHFSDTRLERSFSYSHGYYDGEEREFRGFGRVERRDAERLSTSSEPTDAPPLLTKTWYHSGANLGRDLADYYRKEYYAAGTPGEDKDAPELASWQPEPLLVAAGDKGKPDLATTGGETLRYLPRALHGRVLREEVYGEDIEGHLVPDPYTVSESGYMARLIQDATQAKYPILFVRLREQIATHYEQKGDDPRVQHNFALDVDEYGHLQRSCQVFYPRRKPYDVYPEQQSLRTTAKVNSFLNVVGFDDHDEQLYLAGVPNEQRTFEIGGLQPLGDKLYLTWKNVRDGLDEALQAQINFDDPFAGGSNQARRLSCRRHIYWNADQSAPLPYGTALPAGHGTRALLHHVETAAFSKAYAADIFGREPQTAEMAADGGFQIVEYGAKIAHQEAQQANRFDEDLMAEAGYIERPLHADPPPGEKRDPDDASGDAGEPHWWKPGMIHYFNDNDRFYRLWKTADPGKGGDEIVYQEDGHEIEYDNYSLAVSKTSDPFGSVTAVVTDYQAMHPFRITGINGNVSDALYDPFGRVVASAIYGREDGKERGDTPLPQPRTGRESAADGTQVTAVDPAERDRYFQLTTPARRKDILADPGTYLDTASSRHFYFYGEKEETEQRRPACALDLLREIHESDLAAKAKSPLLIALEYSDGLGRVVQTMQSADPGPVETVGADGTVSVEDAAERWLCTGRTVYNNKGLLARQYEPYYGRTYDYEVETTGARRGASTIHHYDAVHRLVKIKTPAGRSAADPSKWEYDFATTEYLPWRERHRGRNANVQQTERYKNRATLDEDDRDALDKAALFKDVATLFDLDVQGRHFQGRQMLKGTDKESNWLTTHHEFDVEGHERSSTDPELFHSNIKRKKAGQDPLRSFRHHFDMTGMAIYSDSADAGRRWTLYTVLGRPLQQWDSRGFHVTTRYDALRRPLEMRLSGGDGEEAIEDQIVERMIYGEEAGGDTAVRNNLRGRLVAHYDQAGVVFSEAYDIAGNLRKSSRLIRSDYKELAGWNDAGALAAREKDVDAGALFLGEKRYESQWVHDALGRLVKEVHPDGSISRVAHNPHGLLENLTVTYDDGKEERFIENAAYNARGQRTRLDYGNGVSTAYTYDPATFRLAGINTKRGTDAKILQEISLTHDPDGNPTRLREMAQKTLFNGAKVDPLSDYTYDALNRLVMARGREHPALAAGGSANGSAADRARFLHLNDLRQLQSYTQTYDYDGAGNLLGTHHTAADSARSWSRELKKSPTSNRAVPAEWLEGDKEVDDFFDGRGNLKKLENVRQMAWNYQEHIGHVLLIEREDQDPDAEYYVYDAAGRRIRKVTETKTAGGTRITEKIYLGSVEIRRTRLEAGAGSADEESKVERERQSLHIFDGHHRFAVSHRWTEGSTSSTSGCRPFRSLSRGLRRAAGRSRSGNRSAVQSKAGSTIRQSRYQLDNHVGTLSLELNNEGQIITYEEYFPYGGTAVIAGKDQSEVRRKEYRYSGKERDDTTGLYYYGARYYAPWHGRWLSPDPAGTVDGLNLFAFTRLNPVRFSDPSGLQPEDGADEESMPIPVSEPPRSRRASLLQGRPDPSTLPGYLAERRPGVYAKMTPGKERFGGRLVSNTPNDIAQDAIKANSWHKDKLISLKSRLQGQTPEHRERYKSIRAGVAAPIKQAREVMTGPTRVAERITRVAGAAPVAGLSHGARFANARIVQSQLEQAAERTRYHEVAIHMQKELSSVTVVEAIAEIAGMAVEVGVSMTGAIPAAGAAGAAAKKGVEKALGGGRKDFTAAAHAAMAEASERTEQAHPQQRWTSPLHPFGVSQPD